MSEFIHNKTASFFVTLLIGIIILSFMFTGYQTFQGGGGMNAIGKVGDEIIRPEEFQQEYNRQIEFYKQMMGGEINAKQLEGLKIKENALKNLIQRKLMVKFAGVMGANPANEEVTAEIKTLPYFQTNGQFDLNRYKGLLASNKLTPQEFEKDVINQIKMKNTQALVQNYPLSEGYLSDLQKFRNDKLNAEVVTFSKSGLRKFIVIKNEELSKFLAVDTNQKRLLSMFGERKASLDTPKKPAVFEEYKEKLATEILQKDKVEEIKTLSTEVANSVKKALDTSNEKELKAIAAKYSLQYSKSSVNRLDGLTGESYLSSDNMKEIFAGDLTKAKVNLFDDANTITMIKTTPFAATAVATAPDNKKKDANNDIAGLKNALSRKMMDAILKKMEEETKVKIFSSAMQQD
jgi:hypothetical protein